MLKRSASDVRVARQRRLRGNTLASTAETNPPPLTQSSRQQHSLKVSNFRPRSPLPAQFVVSRWTRALVFFGGRPQPTYLVAAHHNTRCSGVKRVPRRISNTKSVTGKNTIATHSTAIRPTKPNVELINACFGFHDTPRRPNSRCARLVNTVTAAVQAAHQTHIGS